MSDKLIENFLQHMAGKQIFDSLPLAVYVTDMEGHLKYYNPAAVKLSGREPELNTNQWCIAWKLYHHDGTPMPHEESPMALFLKEGEDRSGEEVIAERPDGKRIWFKAYPLRLYNNEGEAIGGLNILADITVQKENEKRLIRNEQALRKSEEKYRTLFERMHEGFAILQLEFDENNKPVDWQYLETNPAANRHTGLGNRDGKKVSEILPDLKEDWLEKYGKVALTGNPVQFEDSIEGLQRWLDISAFQIGNPEERKIAVLFTDVTARKERELANAYLGAIVDSSDDAIISKDLDGVIKSWNKSAEKIFGYTAEEAIGQPITIIIPEERLDEEAEILSRIRSGERVDHYETIRQHKDGTLLDISLSISPLKDAEGTIVGASKIARDVTRRKQTEQALRKNEEMYRTLVENFPNGAVALFDKNLRYTAIGGELVKSLGVDPADRIGSKITEIYPQEIVDEVKPYLHGALQGQADSFETKLYDRHLIAQTLPIENNNGEVVAGMVVVLDITERWKAQHALQKSEEKYRSLFQSMNEGFCIIKMEFGDNNEPVNFRYLETNPAYKKHSGLYENIEGKSAKEVLPSLGKDMLRRNGKVALTGEPFHDEIYVKEIDRWLDLSAFRIGDPEKHKVAVLFTNITERKQAQKELKAMNETLEERVKERTQELLSYQDQLRSLAFQLSRAEETQRQQLANELHDNLGQMLALGKIKVNELQNDRFSGQELPAINELKKIINNAITYTRELTSDLKPPPSVNNDIKTSLNWVAEKVGEHGLEVTVDDDGQPKPLDSEIRSTVLQSVRELLFNVIKHTSENKASVRLESIGDHLRVVVKDEGGGFEYKNEKLASVKDGRFGLFSILERIDLIGGQVDIETQHGSGTKVTLQVPLSEKSSKRDISESNQPPEVTETKPIPAQQEERIKVLLVDDHKMFRNGLRKIIEDEEDLMVIGEAGDGQEALNLSRETSPDVILMDVNMPIMDGVEATKKISAMMPDVRIIGVSLHDRQEVAQNMRNAGASAYLTKTEAFESLIVMIRAEASSSAEEE